MLTGDAICEEDEICDRKGVNEHGGTSDGNDTRDVEDAPSAAQRPRSRPDLPLEVSGLTWLEDGLGRRALEEDDEGERLRVARPGSMA